ncbi:glycosyltransferase [Sphaerobacter thermophilus]|uniref:Glycosyltransferase, MGT family n=1 Tax=Sphaerobacter thermophilus (strain ATCC 49802 / DSM 20745 / KCCM 41009 / NCIMB 13125 / S 6022) TaxID=479434 RepID=D1C4T3_SPHTD|nr:nucleotide disphospho-sugar-binding domain-containing protein [Sphaerobacter thermophilus]ACZ39250.1 glycosyltransferase, MGT family [Sphaerobacter thermophilus DSM 20745]
MTGSSNRRTIIFFPEGAFGPTNNCIGIGKILLERGHRVVFVVEESFAGTLAARGFEERLMRLSPPPEVPEEPGQFWKDFIRDTAPHFRKNTFDQIASLTQPIWESLVDGAIYVEPRLREIFAEVQPDVIVEDNVVAFPAMLTAGVPWVRIISCNPLEIAEPDLPPALSGLPTDDRSEWERWRAEYDRCHADLYARFNAFVQENGCPPLPPGQFMYESPWLNLYLYPEEADYPRSRPLPATYHRLDSSVRDTEPPFSVPESLRGEGPLIYVSLGSLGSAEPELMNRLVDLFAGTNYRVIMSLGPQAGQIELPPNIWGEEFLPQPSILPLVDAVVTHGGNNTVTESVHFGKPMLVLPLFWDQHDNAQRVQEVGFGWRLTSYGFTDAEFHEALTDLLRDDARRARMQRIAARLQANPGTVKAADLIERVAVTGEPVLREDVAGTSAGAGDGA